MLFRSEAFLPVPKPANGKKLNISSDLSVLSDAQILDANANPDSFIQTEGTPYGIIAVKAPTAWGLSDAGSKSRVMILDTGIDANHPALNKNIEKTRNFVAGANGSINAADTKDEVGHGTHVSGTVAGQYNDKSGFVGVAPKARILMGKVCSPKGCSTVDISAGIDWAVQEKVDVLSMSLGSPGSTGNPILDLLLEQQAKPMKAALAKAEAAGVFAVAASGNSSADATPATPTEPAKPATNPKIGYPAKLDTVYAVGAVDSKLVKTSFSQFGPELDITAPGAEVLSSVPLQSGRESQVFINISGQKVQIKSASFGGTKEISIPKSAEMIPSGLGKPGEFPAAVAGKFALISRGEIAFSEKVKNAQAAKAIGVVFYNNADGLMQGTVGDPNNPNAPELDYAVVMIEKIEGEKIVEAFKKGQKTIADVSTIKTDYSKFDGTSMACPHVAGVAALTLSAYKIRNPGKTLKPAQLRALLSATASKLGPNPDNKYGAGIVQADKAVLQATKTK